MVHIQEITDEVASKLQMPSSSQDGSPSQNGPASAPAPAAAGPDPSPGRSMTYHKTVDEVVAELKRSPLFMTELEENEETEAFKALAYEGTPLENSSDFKERGNECFKEKRWDDAKEFYTKGILVLRAEERKRQGRDVQGRTVAIDATTKAEQEDKEERGKQRAVLETLYVNRAACHLEVKNYRSCWVDCAAALRINPKNVKAYYRSAKALLAVGRVEEADDACARGLAFDESNKALQAVAREIVKKDEELGKLRKKEEERVAKEKRREMLLQAAIKARGIRMRSTAQPSEMEDAKLQLVPDPDDPRSSLSFPTVLLYPVDLQTDFIKAFNEQESLADHLGYVFPLPWDEKREYTVAGVECYMDTVSGGLIKVGKKLPLLKILSSPSVEVVDEVVRLFVVPKAKADGWVKEYKRKKAVEKGEAQ